jgi:hypothetical protein
MELMALTRATFHFEMSELRASALPNMELMVLTQATFHLEMSALNLVFESNRSAMLPTAAVFQTSIGPYVIAAVVGLVSHAVTAVLMFASLRARWPIAGVASTASTSSVSVVVNGIGRREVDFDTICVPPNFHGSVDSCCTVWSEIVSRSSSCLPAKISRSSDGMASSSWIFASMSSIASPDRT